MSGGATARLSDRDDVCGSTAGERSGVMSAALARILLGFARHDAEGDMAEGLVALAGVVASLKGEQRTVAAGPVHGAAAQSPFQALLSARRAEVVEGAMAAWTAGARVDLPPAGAQPVASSPRARLHAPLPDTVDTSTVPVAGTAVDAAQRVAPAIGTVAAAADAAIVQPLSGTGTPAIDVDAEAGLQGRAGEREPAGTGAAPAPALADAATFDPNQPQPVAVGMAWVDGARAAAIAAPTGQALPPDVRAPGAEAVPLPPGSPAPAVAGGIAAFDAAPDGTTATPLAPGGAPEMRQIAGDDALPAVQGARAVESMGRGGETRLHLALETPLRGPAFTAELSEKLVWLAGRQGQWAALSLNPPHLGNVEVRLTLAAGEASAQFFSAQPAVRDALEAALPRLRELMAGAGIQLGDAQVRDQAFSGRDDAPRFAALPTAGTGLGMSSAGEPVRRHQAGSGLIDLYA